MDPRDGRRPGDHDLLVTLERGRVDDVGLDVVVVTPVESELAEFRPFHGHEPVGCALVGGCPQDHEVLAGQPRQQFVAVGETDHPFLHGSEVLDDAMDVVDGGSNVVLELVVEIGWASVDFDLGPRLDTVVARGGPIAVEPARRDTDHLVGLVPFHLEHRVHQEVDAEPELVEHHPHGVDQEGDVVGDEQQHRAVAVPPIALVVGRDDLDAPLPRRPHPSQREVLHGRAVHLVDTALLGVVLGQLPVIDREELLEEFVVRPSLCGPFLKFGDDVGHAVVYGHREVPSSCGADALTVPRPVRPL